MKKYDINNFYVGNLVILTPIYNSFNNGKNETREKKYLEISKIIKNGAIDLKNYFLEYIDYNKKLKYNNVFTIFYKLDEGYYCLHNGNTYQENITDFDFVENITAFKNCLPKLGFNILDSLSTKEALRLFKSIFEEKGSIPYNQSEFPLNKFYMGSLEIYDGYQKIVDENRHQERYMFRNLADNKILDGNRNLTCNCGYGKLEEISDNLQIQYDFNIINNCIFYLLNDNNFYSLDNFQIYNKGDNLKNDTYLDVVNNLVLFKDKLRKYHIEYNKPSITIPKVLKLQKELMNK